jgi:hypothetical protein
MDECISCVLTVNRARPRIFTRCAILLNHWRKSTRPQASKVVRTEGNCRARTVAAGGVRVGVRKDPCFALTRIDIAAAPYLGLVGAPSQRVGRKLLGGLGAGRVAAARPIGMTRLPGRTPGTIAVSAVGMIQLASASHALPDCLFSRAGDATP